MLVEAQDIAAKCITCSQVRLHCQDFLFVRALAPLESIMGKGEHPYRIAQDCS